MSDTESIELMPRTAELGLIMLFPDEHRWRKAKQSAIVTRFRRYIKDTNCEEIVIKDSRVAEYLCGAPSFQEMKRPISTAYDHGLLSGALLHFVLGANSYDDTKTYATISA